MTETPENPRGGLPIRTRFLGLALLAPALPTWLLVPVSLPPPLRAEGKGWTTAALPVTGEVAFWAPAVVLGREAIRRYKANPGPRRPFRREGE